MRRGGAAEFWRAVDIGLRLGWTPRTLLARRGDHAIDLNPFGCHAGFWTSKKVRMYGVASMKDVLSPRKRPRLKLAPARRARFILEALEWLRTSRWSPRGVDFRLERRGPGWKLTSDLFFWRGEGLYWNSLYMGRGDVEADLKKAGFRVLERGPRFLAFDRDFLPTRELLRKAAWLAAWRPQRLAAAAKRAGSFSKAALQDSAQK